MMRWILVSRRHCRVDTSLAVCGLRREVLFVTSKVRCRMGRGFARSSQLPFHLQHAPEVRKTPQPRRYSQFSLPNESRTPSSPPSHAQAHKSTSTKNQHPLNNPRKTCFEFLRKFYTPQCAQTMRLRAPRTNKKITRRRTENRHEKYRGTLTLLPSLICSVARPVPPTSIPPLWETDLCGMPISLLVRRVKGLRPDSEYLQCTQCVAHSANQTETRREKKKTMIWYLPRKDSVPSYPCTP